MSFTDKKCTEFVSVLASKSPVPGGGGAAALIGSLAAALGAMAANLTIGKKKFLPFEEDHRRIIAEADRLRLRLLALVDEDAAAFEPLTEDAAAVPPDACPALIAAYSFFTACFCRHLEIGLAAACGFSAIRF